MLTHNGEGILSVDIKNKKIKNIFPFPYCYNNVLVGNAGDMFVSRWYGIAKIKGHEISMIIGGYKNIGSLFKGPKDGIWTSSSDTINAKSVLIQLGNDMGEESIFPIEYPCYSIHSVVYIGDNKFIVFGNSGICLFELKNNVINKIRDITTSTNTPSNPSGVIKKSENILLLACQAGPSSTSIIELDVSLNTLSSIAELNIGGTHYMLSPINNQDNAYLLSNCSQDAPEKTLIRLSF